MLALLLAGMQLNYPLTCDSSLRAGLFLSSRRAITRSPFSSAVVRLRHGHHHHRVPPVVSRLAKVASDAVETAMDMHEALAVARRDIARVFRTGGAGNGLA